MNDLRKTQAEAIASTIAMFRDQDRREAERRAATQAQSEAERIARDDDFRATVVASIKAFSGND